MHNMGAGDLAFQHVNLSLGGKGLDIQRLCRFVNSIFSIIVLLWGMDKKVKWNK